MLPFLVAHGAVVACALVALGAGGLFAGLRVVRRLRDRSRALAELRLRSLSIDAPRPGPIAVRGVVRDGGTRLACNGELVALAAPVTIVRGTRAVWPRGAAAATHEVRDGDEVVALGQMTRSADTTASTYRNAAGGWSLAAPVEMERIELCATRPASCPRPLGAARTIAAVAACCALAWGGLFGLATLSTKLGTLDFDGDPRSRTGIGWLAVAAVLPGGGHARDRIPSVAANEVEQTPEALDRMVPLMTCDAAVRTLVLARRTDAAVAQAARCGHPEDALAALFADGRFAEVAAAPRAPRWMTDVRVLAAIAEGQWARAAALAAEARVMPCLVDLLRSHAGDPDASARLADSYNERCHRALELDNTARDRDHALGPLVGSIGDARMWVAESDPPPDGVGYQALVFDAALVRGEVQRAASVIATVEDAEVRAYLAFRLALVGGGPLPDVPANAPGYMRTIADLHAGRAPHRFSLGTCRDEIDLAMEAAAGGDGGPLATILARCPDHRFDDDALLAVAPRITRNKDALRAQLRIRHDASGDEPFLNATVAAFRRDLARLLRDGDEERRWQAIVDRHAAVFAHRDRLVALVVSQFPSL